MAYLLLSGSTACSERKAIFFLKKPIISGGSRKTAIWLIFRCPKNPQQKQGEAQSRVAITKRTFFITTMIAACWKTGSLSSFCYIISLVCSSANLVSPPLMANFIASAGVICPSNKRMRLAGMRYTFPAMEYDMGTYTAT